MLSQQRQRPTSRLPQDRLTTVSARTGISAISSPIEHVTYFDSEILIRERLVDQIESLVGVALGEYRVAGVSGRKNHSHSWMQPKRFLRERRTVQPIRKHHVRKEQMDGFRRSLQQLERGASVSGIGLATAKSFVEKADHSDDASGASREIARSAICRGCDSGAT